MTVDGVHWESRSHRRIHAEVHEQACDAALSLPESVRLWRRIHGDLGEIRSRYESICARLVDPGAGANIEAVAAASSVVFGGLTEARERAALAGGRRARLSELNDRLRFDLPEPVEPVEHRSGFLSDGVSWLAAPDFHHEDARRAGAEERARDLMRAYECDIATDRLTEDAARAAGQRHHQDWATGTGHERTVPMVPLPAAPHHDAMTATVPLPRPGEPADFGPTGYVEPEDEPEDGDTDSTDDRPGPAGGSVPPPRAEVEPAPRRRPPNPFELDVRLPPPVIGGN